MDKQSSVVVFCPSKKHNNEAIDLSLELNIITSATNDMSFKNHKRKTCTYEDDQENLSMAKKLKKFRFYTIKEEAEEKFNGVCTKLTLYDDPWKIKKVLEQSDVNSLCRLMISKRLVKQHIVKEWERGWRYKDIRRLEDRDGVLVKVWDCDRKKEYVLMMKKHVSTDCYVFCTNWRRQFVSERGLKKGDQIGFLWCNFSGRFLFSVLARAPDQPF